MNNSVKDIQTDNVENLPIGELLSRINYPSDLRTLKVDQLPRLCNEIRDFIIANCSMNPGHFASSMGAIEIAVALHYVFNTPYDRIVWDVGHQAYAHKILTGRKEQFKDIRKLGGISGFPSPNESEYDTFVAGHASNAISAALGMAIADMNTKGNESRKTVAVIGDASISGGLAFEGLNNASNNKNNLLIVLNDNDMSIDDNVGALHRYLSHINTSAGYNKWRAKLYNFFKDKGVVNEKGRGIILRFNNSLKALLSHHQNIFEGLNIRYFGPFDGHDVIKLVKVLNDIKDMQGPRLLHLRTKKGKGFLSAEENPAVWHAPGRFNPATGERLKNNDPNQPPLWQQVFGETLVELAKTDERIVGITAAMPSGTSMNMMMAQFPERTFDVGISEGHALTFAGGLAAAGKHPFVAIYSSFLQRAYDNVIHDIAIQGLPVTICIDRAGLVGEDGVTHHGLLDLSFLHCIPGMMVSSPMDEATLRNLMFTSISHEGPIAIRYPRGKATTNDWQTPMEMIECGKGRIISERDNSSIAILSLGPVGNDVQEALKMLDEKEISASHYDMIWLKPLDEELLGRIAKRYKGIVTVEDGALEGGFGSVVARWLQQSGIDIPLKCLGVGDQWVYHGSVAQLKSICGYDADAIVRAVEQLNSKVNL